jgi:arginine N-succinyltransferase
MTYAEADRLSKKNKEFVKGLFPEGPIYASLLPLDAQGVIGRVGAQTKGVERMLRRIGFRYAYRVDPFDGGPHFTAMTDDVSLVQRSFRAPMSCRLERGAAMAAVKERALVAVEPKGPPFFQAALVPWRREPSGVALDEDAALHLGVAEGDEVWLLPLD